MKQKKVKNSPRKLYSIDLAISLTAPYLIHGSEPSKYGLDNVLLRDHRHRPIISGSLLVGRIVETWQALANQLDKPKTKEWFGAQGAERGKRSRVMVDDLHLTQIDGQDIDIQDISVQKMEEQLHTTHRTRIDELSETVKEGHLLMIEQIAPAGAELTFTGQWHVFATGDEIQSLSSQMLMALSFQTQLGANRNIGFGRLANVHIDYHQLVEPYPNAPNLTTKNNHTNQIESQDSPPIYRLALTTEQSICVASKSRRGNVFESDSIITGATILGTIATMLANKHGVAHIGMLAGDKVSSQLSTHFSSIRCTHALPTASGQSRPYPLPQSLLKVDDKIVDAWQYQQAPTELKTPPAFQTDWKGADFAKAAERYSQQHWGQLHKHLKVRTAIDKLGKAEDGSLFAYECYYSPFIGTQQEGKDNKEDKKLATEWQFDLDLRQVDASAVAQVQQELTDLLAYGLFPVGKTDAKMMVHAVNETTNKATNKTVNHTPSNIIPSKTDDNDNTSAVFIPIMLVTDAMLFTTDAMISTEHQEVSLLQVYQQSFNEMIRQSLDELGLTSTSSLTLCLSLHHFFATQKMVGGEYLYHRFQKHRFQKNKPQENNAEPSGYQPWIMTEAGSVFVMKVEPSQSDNALKILNQWQQYGLKLPQSIVERYGDSWDKNPFIRQNGYGEIVINPQQLMNFELLSSNEQS